MCTQDGDASEGVDGPYADGLVVRAAEELSVGDAQAIDDAGVPPQLGDGAERGEVEDVDQVLEGGREQHVVGDLQAVHRAERALHRPHALEAVRPPCADGEHLHGVVRPRVQHRAAWGDRAGGHHERAHPVVEPLDGVQLLVGRQVPDGDLLERAADQVPARGGDQAAHQVARLHRVHALARAQAPHLDALVRRPAEDLVAAVDRHRVHDGLRLVAPEHVQALARREAPHPHRRVGAPRHQEPAVVRARQRPHRPLVPVQRVDALDLPAALRQHVGVRVLPVRPRPVPARLVVQLRPQGIRHRRRDVDRGAGVHQVGHGGRREGQLLRGGKRLEPPQLGLRVSELLAGLLQRLREVLEGHLEAAVLHFDQRHFFVLLVLLLMLLLLLLMLL